MSLPLALISFLIFTSLVGAISWWRTRLLDNTASTYYIAGRKLPWIQITGALLLTNLSTEQLIGLNGAASIHGAVVMAWEIVAVFALIAMAWFFLPRYWAGNVTTVPEFIEQRFDSGTRQMLSVILLIKLMFNVIPFVLYSGAMAMSSMFNLPQLLGITEVAAVWLMVWSITLIGAAYVIFGGMKAVALSDTLYGAGLIVGGLLIPVLALLRLGDGSFSAGLARMLADQGAQLNPIGSDRSNIPFSTLFTGMLLLNLFYWCTNQMIVQRSFGARSFAEAQKGILATAALKLLGPLYLVFPGIIAAEMFGATVIGNGDTAYARLVEAVLPAWLVGFFAAILFGSIISSFNGGLHSAATLFSIDLYRGWFRPGASEREMLRAGKIFAAVGCIASVFVSDLLGGAPEGIFTLMKRFMTALVVPPLAVVMMGMFSIRAPAWAAKAALLGGVALYFLLEALFGNGSVGVTLHWLHIGALNTGLLCAFLAITARLWPAAVTARKARQASDAPAADVTPWPGLRIASIVVGVLAVIIYAGLWLFTRAVKPDFTP